MRLFNTAPNRLDYLDLGQLTSRAAGDVVCASVHRHPALGFEVAFLLLELFPIDLATRIALLEDI